MSSCYTAAGPKMLVSTAVDESFQIVHPCSRLDERDSHACYSVVWLYVLDNEGWALMFCK